MNCYILIVDLSFYKVDKYCQINMFCGELLLEWTEYSVWIYQRVDLLHYGVDSIVVQTLNISNLFTNILF